MSSPVASAGAGADATTAPVSSTPSPSSPTVSIPILEPGVSAGMHVLLQFVLVTLNMLLGYCAIVGTFRPHFEVLFAMSLGLSGCYIWLMFEMAKLPPRETEHGKKE